MALEQWDMRHPQFNQPHAFTSVTRIHLGAAKAGEMQGVKVVLFGLQDATSDATEAFWVTVDILVKSCGARR